MESNRRQVRFVDPPPSSSLSTSSNQPQHEITTMASPPPPKASLLGLPTELRLKIFSHLFASTITDNFLGFFWLSTSMQHGRWETRFRHNPPHPPLSLLFTNHQLYTEATSVLYANCSVSLTLKASEPHVHTVYSTSAAPVPLRLQAWRLGAHIRTLQLTVLFSSQRRAARETVARAHDLVAASQSWGNLRNVTVAFTVPGEDALPGYYPEVVEILKGMRRVKGEVVVVIQDGEGGVDVQDELCVELEKALREEEEEEE